MVSAPSYTERQWHRWVIHRVLTAAALASLGTLLFQLRGAVASLVGLGPAGAPSLSLLSLFAIAIGPLGVAFPCWAVRSHVVPSR